MKLAISLRRKFCGNTGPDDVLLLAAFFVLMMVS